MATRPYYNGIGSQIYAYAPDTRRGDELDIVTINYNETQNKLPIYGYKSFLWDSVMYGDVVVQGNFTLNKKNSITLHNYIGNAPHPELENIPTKFGDSLITQSKFLIILKHTTQVIEAAPTYKKIDTKTVFRIEDVEIIGVEHAISADGNPIGEFYSFVGKRVSDTPSIENLHSGAPV